MTYTWKTISNTAFGKLAHYTFANDILNNLAYLKQELEAIESSAGGAGMFPELGHDYPSDGVTKTYSGGGLDAALIQAENVVISGSNTIFASPQIIHCRTLTIGANAKLDGKGLGCYGGRQESDLIVWGQGALSPYQFRDNDTDELDMKEAPLLFPYVLARGGGGSWAAQNALNGLNPISLIELIRRGCKGGGGGGCGGYGGTASKAGEGGLGGAGGTEGALNGDLCGGGSGIAGGGAGALGITGGERAKGGNGGALILIICETIAVTGGATTLTVDVSGNPGANAATGGGGGGGGGGAFAALFETNATGFTFTCAGACIDGGAGGTGDSGNNGLAGGTGYFYHTPYQI